jgi:predicted transposase/invertase (TIGR01784 family)
MNYNRTRFIDPMVDFAFKKIFGTEPNKDLLIAFLNEVLRGKNHILDLVYSKTEYLGDIEDEGSALFDLLCRGDDGEQFIIEVQRNKPKNFKERALFYTSRLISEQAPSGNRSGWNYNLTKVYLIAILEDLTLDELPTNNYLYDICLCNPETGKVFYDKLGYTYIELAKFVKGEDELDTALEEWLYALKHLSRLDKIPVYLRKPIFEKLFKIAEYTNLSKEEKMLYDSSLKRKWDKQALMEGAIEEGMKQGIEQGIQQGIQQGIEQGIEQGIQQGAEKTQLEIAKALKAEGLSTKLISKTTGLSVQDIEKL